MRWVGIDEAGYGPNLGPLVMTAVIAEDRQLDGGPTGASQHPAPDLWRDLQSTVSRAGCHSACLWVDDSKRILRGGQGRDRLEATCLALMGTVSQELPRNATELLATLGAGTLEDAELHRWSDSSRGNGLWPKAELLYELRNLLARKPLQPAGNWRIEAVRTVVLGPERFNRALSQAESKARVHFLLFQALLQDAWERAGDGLLTVVDGDKHGGRHYYFESLIGAFPDVWIDRGTEGPELSRYSLCAPGRRLTLNLAPRADAANGLVALASIVSKTVREVWMDHFNAFWAEQVPGLKPTAGYPVDAARFRRDIEIAAIQKGLDPRLWWREK